MTNETLKGIFIAINDGWSNFQIPRSEAILNIWRQALNPYPDKTIMTAIETIYKTEHFFSFAKLIEVLTSMTTPQLPEPGEVIQTIKKLASNSNRDISDQPEHIRRTIDYMGGLKAIGQQPWDQWLEKRIGERYEEAKASMGKQELKQLGQVAERLGIE